MTDKIDNPQDHQHSDYSGSYAFAFGSLLLALVALISGLITSCALGNQVDKLEQRYCQLAPDSKDYCKVVPK